MICDCGHTLENTGGCLRCRVRVICTCGVILSCSCGRVVENHQCPLVTVIPTAASQLREISS